MNAGLIRRLERLEAKTPDATALSSLSDDELNIRYLDLLRKVEDGPDLAEEARECFRNRRQVIEAGIRYQASLHLRPGYQTHLARILAQRSDHVPAIFGFHISDGVFSDGGFVEYQNDQRTVDMRRRAELRARPDIAALIAEGMAA